MTESASGSSGSSSPSGEGGDLERRLAEAEAECARLREMIQNMSYGVVVVRRTEDRRGFIVVEMNRGAEALESVRAEEAVGQLLSRAFPYVVGSGLLDVLHRAADTGIPQRHQTILKGGGELTHCHSDYVYRLPTGELVVVYHDLTELRRAQERLRLLGTAVQDAGDGIVIMESDLTATGPTIVFVNSGFTRITGYKGSEVVGKSIRVLNGPKTDPNVLADLWSGMRAARPWSGVTYHYRKDRESFLMEWNLSPVFDEDNEPTHFVAFLRDVTAREQARQTERLSEQMSLIARTAATYNHEINTPLQSILGYVHLLMKGETDGERLEALDAILRSAERIEEVTQKIAMISGPVFTSYVGETMMLDIENGTGREKKGENARS